MLRALTGIGPRPAWLWRHCQCMPRLKLSHVHPLRRRLPLGARRCQAGRSRKRSAAAPTTGWLGRCARCFAPTHVASLTNAHAHAPRARPRARPRPRPRPHPPHHPHHHPQHHRHHHSHPAALQVRFEAFCLNQCSGHGRCDNHGGYCHCEPGFSGVDCSILTLREAGAARVTAGEGGGAVVLHPGHAARRGARRPSIYVYELPEHTSLILQLMAPGAMCAHRCNHAC